MARAPKTPAPWELVEHHDAARGQKSRASLVRFDSVGEWAEYSAGPTRLETMKEHRAKVGSMADHGAAFCPVNYSQALHLARDGDPEGRAMMLRDVAGIPAAASGFGRRDGYDVAGAFPDVARFVGGDPCHMVTTADDPTERARVLTVRLWCAVSALVRTETIRAWGAGVASHVDALEAEGWRVDLWALPFISGGRHGETFTYHAQLVRVKAAEQHLDVDALAFIASHPAALRKIGFGVWERTPDSICARGLGQSYGSPRYPSTAAPWLKDALNIAGPAIDLPGANAAPAGCTPRQAADMIGSILRGQMPDGFEIEDAAA